MQHVLNIAFDFDDERVKTIAENAIQNDIDKIIENIVLDVIAPKEYSYFSRTLERNHKYLKQKLDDRIDVILNEHKDEIIEQAAQKLYDGLKRTKVWKERRLEVIDDV